MTEDEDKAYKEEERKAIVADGQLPAPARWVCMNCSTRVSFWRDRCNACGMKRN